MTTLSLFLWTAWCILAVKHEKGWVIQGTAPKWQCQCCSHCAGSSIRGESFTVSRQFDLLLLCQALFSEFIDADSLMWLQLRNKEHPLYGTCCVIGTVLHALHVLTHLILTTTPGQYCPHVVGTFIRTEDFHNWGWSEKKPKEKTKVYPGAPKRKTLIWGPQPPSQRVSQALSGLSELSGELPSLKVIPWLPGSLLTTHPGLM